MTDSQAKPFHAENIHRHGYDFDQLTEAHPALQRFILKAPHGGLTINFADADAVKALNAAILSHCYQIKNWDIPCGALCPPVPGRVDYVHYMADLLAQKKRESTSRMLDIGTGANGIYPLLANRVYGWQCVASDISSNSLANVEIILNSNTDIDVTLRLQPDKHSMFNHIIQADEYFDLTMCNPPFHASADEALRSARSKQVGLARSQGKTPDRQVSDLNFGGMENELWCNGGETLFLKKMAKESAHFASQVGWFSSLVSKAETVKPLKKQLTKLKATDIREIEMVQGKKITRIIAWTFE